MFKLFGILLLAIAVWQLRAVIQTKPEKPAAGAVAVPHESIGYAVFLAGILVVMGLAILIGWF